MRQVDATVEGKTSYVDRRRLHSLKYSSKHRKARHLIPREFFYGEYDCRWHLKNSGNEHERVNKTREDNLR